MEWGDFFDSAAQQAITNYVAPKPTTPAVATNPQTGTSYAEGQPASTVGALLTNPLVLVGGVAALGLVVWLAVRK